MVYIFRFKRTSKKREQNRESKRDSQIKDAYEKACQRTVNSFYSSQPDKGIKDRTDVNQPSRAPGNKSESGVQNQTDWEQSLREQRDMIARTVPATIEECKKLVTNIFNNSFDMVIQVFETKADQAMMVFVDGMVNRDLIDRDIMHPLKREDFSGNVPLAIKSPYMESESMSEIVKQVLSGFVALFYSGSRKAYLVEFRGWQQRTVSEPEAEKSIRGPKEGFIESIRVNTALIRRKIQNPNLMIESVKIGEQTHTEIELVYIRGIVNRDVLAQVKKRLSEIDVGSILESGYIEQYISEYTLAPISGIGITQKPDILAARILEGRVGILCDGTPHVLTIPELFIENIQVTEDYYERPVYGSIIRLYRLFGFVITTMLPGFAVAMITYAPEMIPGVFLSAIIKSMLKTPMTLSAEIFSMMLMFELLREAGIRLPQAVGSAITIVGSLIIGQAATAAGIVSETAVIIVAVTAVSSFMVSNLTSFTLVYRFFFWFMGSIMGLIGMGFAFFIMMTQIISTNSFGIPVLSSFGKGERKDSFIRFPWRSMRFRPESIAKDNRRRSDM